MRTMPHRTQPTPQVPVTALSSYWGTSLARQMEAPGVTTEMRLALVLSAVRSLVRVVDDQRPAMKVDWAAMGSKDSGTHFGENRVEITPAPVTGGMPAGAALDVCAGLAVHEGAHARHSRNIRLGYAFIEPAERPIADWLFNVLRDIHDQAAMTAEWPGFAPYLRAALDWTWQGRYEGAHPDDRGLDAHLDVALVSCRWPDRAADYIAGTSWEPEEVQWWVGWQAGYMAGALDAQESVEKALEHLREDQGTQDDIDDGVTPEFDPCVSGAPAPERLDPMASAFVEALIDQQLQIVIPDTGRDGVPTVILSKPTEDDRSRRAAVAGPEADALRAALAFRPETPRHEIKLQFSGDLDDTEIHRWAEGDYRLFTERSIESQPDAFMGLLVDLSGSMTWGKLPIAQRLATGFLWAARDIEGIETAVWGHTGDSPARTAAVYRIWEQGDPMSRLGLISTLPHANNYDGYAIITCVTAIAAKPQAQKVLFVLSDGLPHGQAGYGYTFGRKHVRSAVETAARKGVTVIQIAIGTDLKPADQAEMFGNWVPFQSYAQLPRDLTRLMERFLQ